MHRSVLITRVLLGLAASCLLYIGIAYAAAPDTPTNTTPIDGAGSQSQSPTLTASAFSDSDLDTHAASEWQVATENLFASPVWDSGEDAVNLTSVVVPITLENNIKYYWHVKYKDSNGDWGAYSDPTSFTSAKTDITAIGSLEFKSSEVAILAVMVKDSNGNPVLSGSGATASIDIFNPSQSQVVTGDAMTYLTSSLGVFYYGYTTPATTGVYTFVTNVTYNDQTSYSASTFHVSAVLNTINTNLDTTISSRASQTSLNTASTNVSSIKSTVDTNLNATVSSRASQTSLDTVGTNVSDTQATVNTIDTTTDTINTNLDTVSTNVDTISTNLDTVSGNVDTISSNLDTVSTNVDSINTNVSTLLDDVAAVNDTVDDIKTVVTTIDVHVDDIADTTDETLVRTKDIQDTTDNTLSRVKDIQSDLTDIKSKLRSVSSDITSVSDALDVLSTTVQNNDATLLTALNTQLGFSGKSGSVQTTLTDVTNRIQGIYTQLGIHATEIDQIVALDTAGEQNLKSILNQLSTLKAAASAAETVVSQKPSQPSTTVNSWFSFGSIIEHFLVVNPTNQTKTIPVKGYLPAEIATNDILSLDGMKTSFDTEKKQIVVTTEITLKPGESHVFSVEMKDIYAIKTSELTGITDTANSAITALRRSGTANTQAETLYNTIVSRIDAITKSQSDTTLTAVQKMDTYRANQKALEKAQENLSTLSALRSASERGSLPIGSLVWIASGLVAAFVILRYFHVILSHLSVILRHSKDGTHKVPHRASALQSPGEQVRWHDFLRQFRH